MKFSGIKRTIVILLFWFAASNCALAQLSYSFATDQEYNDNPFQSTLAQKTFISSFNFGVENNFDFLEVGYYGSYLNFNVIPERNFYWHQLSISKEFENSSIGLYAEQRLNKDIYTYYNYTNISAYYNQQFTIEDFFVTLAPSLSLTKYSQIPIMDNTKASLSYSINKGFETGTTLILGGALNYKRYITPTQTGTYDYLDENNLLVTESYLDKNITSLTQLVSYFRTAQSITETTGLATQFTNRSIFTKVNSFVKELNMIYGDESEMFDDPVNYEGNNISLELTQVLFEDMQIKAGYSLNRKQYISQGAYDNLLNYQTGVMRSDTQNIFSISVSKSFGTELFNGSQISVGLNFRSTNNQSNSYLFNYKSNSINLNLGLDL